MTALTTAELDVIAARMSEVGVVPTRNLRASAIAGGRSNLTYVVTDGDSSWVLRMPPRGGRTASAHDVGREFRVTSALADTRVPVPAAVLLCEDEAPLGVPFTVSEFVPGASLRTQSDLSGYTDDGLKTLTTALLEGLAALHSVDPHEVGLERFGRPDGYAERQLQRWTGQWNVVGSDSLRSLADEVVIGLERSVPGQSASAIVHGDFRVDNTIVVGTRLSAIVDWELSTLGDPVADVAMMCAYRHAPFDLVVGEPAAWTSERLPDVHGLVTGYEQAGGAPLANLEFHLALACYKVAVIAAGIDHRRRAGSGSGPGFDTAGDAAEPFLELALARLQMVS